MAHFQPILPPAHVVSSSLRNLVQHQKLVVPWLLRRKELPHIGSRALERRAISSPVRGCVCSLLLFSTRGASVAIPRQVEASNLCCYGRRLRLDSYLLIVLLDFHGGGRRRGHGQRFIRRYHRVLILHRAVGATLCSAGGLLLCGFCHGKSRKSIHPYIRMIAGRDTTPGPLPEQSACSSCIAGHPRHLGPHQLSQLVLSKCPPPPPSFNLWLRAHDRSLHAP